MTRRVGRIPRAGAKPENHSNESSTLCSRRCEVEGFVATEVATPARFAELQEIVGRPIDLSPEQWDVLYRRAVAYRPSLIVELGRNLGNSTVVLTEAAHAIGCRVVSVGMDSRDSKMRFLRGQTSAWERKTVPQLLPVVGPDWFAPLTVLHLDITRTDWRWLPEHDRALLFWDAHGADVADSVMSRLLPRLPNALIAMHDVGRVEPGSAATTSRTRAWGRKPDLYTWRDLASTFEEVQSIAPLLETRSYEVDGGILWFALGSSP